MVIGLFSLTLPGKFGVNHLFLDPNGHQLPWCCGSASQQLRTAGAAKAQPGFLGPARSKSYTFQFEVAKYGYTWTKNVAKLFRVWDPTSSVYGNVTTSTALNHRRIVAVLHKLRQLAFRILTARVCLTGSIGYSFANAIWKEIVIFFPNSIIEGMDFELRTTYWMVPKSRIHLNMVISIEQMMINYVCF